MFVCSSSDPKSAVTLTCLDAAEGEVCSRGTRVGSLDVPPTVVQSYFLFVKSSGVRAVAGCHSGAVALYLMLPSRQNKRERERGEGGEGPDQMRRQL